MGLSNSLLFVLLAHLTLTPSNKQKELLLFGGPNHDEYLGCLVCSEFKRDSICNGFGRYGNEFSTKGMFNSFAGYGNSFNSKSPWNEVSMSKSVPVVVDRDGKFYGFFTINDSRSDAVEFAEVLKKMYNDASGDLEKTRKLLCKSLGYSG